MCLNTFKVSMFFFSFFSFKYTHICSVAVHVSGTHAVIFCLRLQSFFWTLLITPDVPWSHLADKLERTTEKRSGQRKPGLNTYGLSKQLAKFGSYPSLQQPFSKKHRKNNNRSLKMLSVLNFLEKSHKIPSTNSSKYTLDIE